MSKSPRLYSPYDAPMWESIAEGQMKLQRCTESGTFRSVSYTHLTLPTKA